MIKIIKEFIPDRPGQNGARIKGHVVMYTYNTKHIKRKCVNCKQKIRDRDREQGYLQRGNYCTSCCHDYYLATK